MGNIGIFIALHKQYSYPKSVPYIAIQVGAKDKEKFLDVSDDTGDNISEKNPYFCELTALYWAWKNSDCDYLGLVHYRRYFKGRLKFEVNGKKKGVLSKEECDGLLRKADVILPKKRKYYIETLYSHYAHTMYVEPLDLTGEIIKKKYGDYYAEFLRLKKRRSAHIFNMAVMKKEIFDKYCEWLFSILFELESEVDFTKYSDFHARFFGRISELLLDVYINVNKIKYTEVKVISVEKTKWLKKILGFLGAKLFKKKYDKSF